MKKRILTLLLALSLLLSMTAGAFAGDVGLDNFRKVNAYNGNFGDVPAGQWYYSYVVAAYEYGLMKGQGGGRFDPDGTVTLAETVTMASRIHNIYMGGNGQFTQAPGGKWYQVYVDYALEKGLLQKTFSDYNRPATRAEFADILSRTLMECDFSHMNPAPYGSIPDVYMGEYYYSIYTLYRSGVLTGKDAAGSFDPYANIKRSEAAAVMIRIVEPHSRVVIDKTAAALLEELEMDYVMTNELMRREAKAVYYGASAAAYILGNQVIGFTEYPEYNPDYDGYAPGAVEATYYYADGEMFCARLVTPGTGYAINIYYSDGEIVMIQDNGFYYCAAGHPEGDAFAALPADNRADYEHICNTWRNFAWW